MSDWEAIASALAAAPRLPGARCVGDWSIFDETDNPEIVEYAKNQCQACPALAECRSWFESLKPSKRPPGTVAGQLVHPTQ